jgi:OOP family OmpA-OmpF porin
MNNAPLIHLDRLARRLNATPSEESESSFMAMLADFKTLTDTGYKCLLSVGAMAVLAYLLVSVQFYPSGLTIGDAFFFLMVAFAFGFAYSVFILAGFLVVQLADLFWQQRNKGWLRMALAVICVIAILYGVCSGVAVLFSSNQSKMLGVIFAAVVGFTFSGFCLTLLIASLDRPLPSKSRRWYRAVLWVALLVSPLAFSSGFIQLINENVVMPKVGLRLTNVTLKLSEENYDLLASVAAGQNIAVLGCKTSSTGQPDRLVHGVNLLWHGLGERSLVELPSGKTPNLIVELKRDGVFALRNYSGPIERCLELSSDLLFEAGSSALSSDDGDLKEILKVLVANKSTIEKIQVIGHADALGHAGNAKENSRLALDRAKTVKTSIDAANVVSKESVTADGHGAREPKTLCKDWPVKATLSECLAVNRRVEVRIQFKPPVQDPPEKSAQAAAAAKT